MHMQEQERIWLKHQTNGDLDDSRLVDGATGDRNVYKKRGKDDKMFGKIQRKPKRISFCVDVSSSMSVMNSDGRLDRVCATVVMIMEVRPFLVPRDSFKWFMFNRGLPVRVSILVLANPNNCATAPRAGFCGNGTQVPAQYNWSQR